MSRGKRDTPQRDILRTITRVVADQGIPVSIGCFGSVVYNNLSRLNDTLNPSDLDIFFMLPSKEAITYFQNPAIVRQLSKTYNLPNAGRHLAPFKSTALEAWASGHVGILQRMMHVETTNSNGVPVCISVDMYFSTYDDLRQICAVEPGGELNQWYSSPPARKAIVPYEFMTTSGVIVQYEQGVELFFSDRRQVNVKEYCKDGKNLDDLEQIVTSDCQYHKKSPGLPRIKSTNRGYPKRTSSDEGQAAHVPIMIGTTGDKVLTMRLTYDPEDIASTTVLIPAFARTAADFYHFQNLAKGDNLEHLPSFASLFHRFRLGNLSARYISCMEGVYQKAVPSSNQSISKDDLWLEPWLGALQD